MKSLAKKCDKLFSEIIRKRGKCEACGSTENLQCAHIHSRRYRNIRWNISNAICLCRGHHFYYTNHPLEWEQFIYEIRGREVWEDLKKEALLAPLKIDHKQIILKLNEEAK